MRESFAALSAESREHVLTLLRSNRDHWLSAARIAGGRDTWRILERARAFSAAYLELQASSSPPPRTTIAPSSNPSSTVIGSTASLPANTAPHLHRSAPGTSSEAQAGQMATTMDTLSSVVAAIECGEVRS